ncbi:hypothetical protein M758_8G118300 [Ceratodon purpureus]|nr:hypothetical protein M758_8G118300 [Ceratodon purpureus]
MTTGKKRKSPFANRSASPLPRLSLHSCSRRLKFLQTLIKIIPLRNEVQIPPTAVQPKETQHLSRTQFHTNLKSRNRKEAENSSAKCSTSLNVSAPAIEPKLLLKRL